ncbi:acylphosphatase [Vibrio sp. ZSDZ34]|uniref:Acylphosphatase n=1 Tax=Vibrio gelatinilyticus TaxID=2893468 RepID=A0A9X1WAR4_9VIBR|nr:acylphosphatase [Vibrio gelatinilyticus]MCJ2376641.1 acylphosphatase [Vibrio gelatinilyticus]
MTKVCQRMCIRGMVQGVGFRYHTCHEALKLGLTGYAMNLNDGSVEVIACGESAHILKLYEWLKTGPRTSRVDTVSFEHTDLKNYTGFVIR